MKVNSSSISMMKTTVLVIAIVFAGSCNLLRDARRDANSDKGSRRIDQADCALSYEVYTAWPFDDAEAERRQKETAAGLGVPVEWRLPLGDDVHVDLVLIPAGRFVMGMEGVTDNEPHEVTIDRPFYIGKYELTWRQYLVFPQDSHLTSRAVKSDLDYDKTRIDYPARTMSWNTCRGFCKEASRATGCNIRLPLEAEWEYACRAGTTGRYIWGDTVRPGDANIMEWKNEEGKYISVPPLAGRKHGIKKVGLYKPNPWGLYDMLGNIPEWVFDKYDEDERVRTVRDYGGGNRVADRMPELDSTSKGQVGFRIAVDINAALKSLQKNGKEKSQATDEPSADKALDKDNRKSASKDNASDDN